MDDRSKEDSVTLEILEAIDQSSNVTQRTLARRTGVALGLTNLYLKRCVRKGLIKIQQAPANRYLYYLTPKGFAEKSRLTAKYLSYSFGFYRRASTSCLEALEHCKRQDWQRVVFCGASELAEIASLRAQELDLDVVAVCDPEYAGRVFVGKVVAGSLEECGAFDACLLTDLRDPRRSYEALSGDVDEERLLVPDILGLKTNSSGFTQYN